ncbi:AraC family transcriptional regulator [Georgenia sp. SYP-B2076]|uniref:AraC family transcriptional regulator n=1 Tax=Georgenia sp. SYP-B2076 TaxID=2495881 RepID=UPI000F8D1926|nr:AraC family transcriptional regulator [Georgenia sp. SYP-B2076]
MDSVLGMLDGPRARGAFLLRTVMNPPWSLRIQDEAPLTLVAMVAGGAHVLPDHAVPAELGPGDVAILRGPDAYTIADDPRTAPQAVIHPGQRCTTVDGAELLGISSLGVRTWGNDPAGSTVMLTGTYQLPHEVGRQLLAALPPLALLRRADWDEPLVGLVAREVTADRPGQEVVLDRLLDLLLVAGLRRWFDRRAGEAPGWYRAGGDPVVGRAVRLMENSLAHPWTVASLAATVGVSRAALARRFTELVAQPPMAFLTQRRLELAADLLLEPGSTLGAVARQTGYATPFALSAAFRRVRGETPQQHRARARRGTDVPADIAAAVPLTPR